jgi:hypothetical protein
VEYVQVKQVSKNGGLWNYISKLRVEFNARFSNYLQSCDVSADQKRILVHESRILVLETGKNTKWPYLDITGVTAE